MATDHEAARARMVRAQLEGRGIADRRVLAAMGAVPRHRFVPPELRERAYEDTPLPIGSGQTISQPYMVAVMTEALGLADEEAHVLEVGTGSGYQTAVLAALGVRVTSIERIESLADRAREVIDGIGLGERVTIAVGDGTLGWEAGAPFDAILVTAGAPGIPRPLIAQLAPHGRLVVPVGEEELQTLVRLRRGAEGLVEEYLGECRFVKLQGSHGWEES